MKPPRSGVRTGSSGIGAEGLLDDRVRVITHAREWRRCLLPTAGFARKQPFLSQVGAFSFKQALLHENPFSWRAEPCAQPQAATLARHGHRRLPRPEHRYPAIGKSAHAPRGNRVLYTIDALHPDRARLVALPNLRRAHGLAFNAEEGADFCLQFPMPVD